MVLILIAVTVRAVCVFEYGVIPNGAYTFNSHNVFVPPFEYGVIPNGAYTSECFR